MYNAKETMFFTTATLHELTNQESEDNHSTIS